MLRLTQAEPADLQAVRAVLEAAALPTDDVDAALLAGFVVLREGDSVCGTAAIEPLEGCALLRSVAVAAHLRGQGQGERLTAAAEAKAALRGLVPLYLLTTTAAPFFARRGYREVPRDAVPAVVQASREFSALCPTSAVVMVKP